ncbi:hypothetical protein CK203_072720 [Vitis vinifera]|uniref:Uncharacterized protein n=1 Tax=Vitis vinifera TaxID=29760 RepID=A0A438EYV3_VITVI|nr:hypothetical protein CK203_072720 [Vitis vinifera]
MQAFRQILAGGHCSPVLRIGVRVLSTSDSASLKRTSPLFWIPSLLSQFLHSKFSFLLFSCIFLVAKWVTAGATLVQNCGDSEIGKVVIQLAKERKLQTLSIIDDKPGSADTIEELKALGADIVVPESYTKTWFDKLASEKKISLQTAASFCIWYMKRLAGEMSPSAGLNFSDGYQATAVCKAVTSGEHFSHMERNYPSMLPMKDQPVNQLNGALSSRKRR